MPRVLLLNDTYAAYHWGCTATSAAIRKRIVGLGFDLIAVSILQTYSLKNLPETSVDFDDPQFFRRSCRDDPELFDALSDADVVVINGEGTMHSMHHGSAALLYVAHAATRHLNKPVQIINHSFYPDGNEGASQSVETQLYQLVYRHLDFVAAREHFSHSLLKQAGIDATLSFDCLPITLQEDYQRPSPPQKPHVVIGGSAVFPVEQTPEWARFMQRMIDGGFAVSVLIGAANLTAQEDIDFAEALRKHGDFGWQLVRAESLKQWLDCLASATLLVSGRFHYTIAAAFLNVPCAVLESNTPKNRALAECLGLESPLGYQDGDLESALMQRAERALKAGPVDTAALESLREHAERNFDGLRKLA